VKTKATPMIASRQSGDEAKAKAPRLACVLPRSTQAHEHASLHAHENGEAGMRLRGRRDLKPRHEPIKGAPLAAGARDKGGGQRVTKSPGRRM
jgi:hypothetical protein